MSLIPSDLPPPPDDGGATGDDESDAEMASVLAWALPPAAPGDGLLERLLARARATAVATLRRADGMWFRVADGVSRKLVFLDAQERGSTAIWRLDAGATTTVEATPGDDVVFVVIEGTIVAEEAGVSHALVTGDAVGVHAARVQLKAESPAAVLVAVSFGAIEGPPGVQVVRAELTPAIALNADVTAKPLFLHRAPRPDVAVLTVRANGALDEHEHPETEELLCLEGTCQSHGELLEPGDYQRARAGSAHDQTTTATGSTILVLRRHFT
ncbi:MAG: cupin domain-containing protein [Gemmatimonadaceae bacterium]|nr:cupin domain-containing protein [Gemmatimonadaceae bacterium]